MEYIIGKVKEKFKDFILIESNSIGYKVFINSVFTIQLNIEIKIYIYTKYSFINSNILMNRYGFINLETKYFFEKLIAINGIGPKYALNLLEIDYDILIENILKNNINFFIIEKKINKKVIDLVFKNIKIDNSKYNFKKLDDIDLKNRHNLIESLEYLGFSKKEINISINDINFKDSLENLIKISLEKKSKIREKNYD